MRPSRAHSTRAPTGCAGAALGRTTPERARQSHGRPGTRLPAKHDVDEVRIDLIRPCTALMSEISVSTTEPAPGSVSAMSAPLMLNGRNAHPPHSPADALESAQLYLCRRPQRPQSHGAKPRPKEFTRGATRSVAARATVRCPRFALKRPGTGIRVGEIPRSLQ